MTITGKRVRYSLERKSDVTKSADIMTFLHEDFYLGSDDEGDRKCGLITIFPIFIDTMKDLRGLSWNWEITRGTAFQIRP